MSCLSLHKFLKVIQQLICSFRTLLIVGAEVIANLMKMQILEEDDDLAYGGTPDEEQKIVDGRPTWMKTLHTSVSTWMTLVPKVMYGEGFNL